MLFKIFESGKYPQGEFGAEQVRKIADIYDPEGDIEAPCVVGHMNNALAERIENELSHGWVAGLLYIEQDGTGQLWADVEPSPELMAHLAGRRLRYVSAELTKREDNALYLVRLAFLGRSIPAVVTARVPAAFRWIGAPILKTLGLKFAEQSDSEEPLCFCRKLEFREEEAREREPEPRNTQKSVEKPNKNDPDTGGENMAKISEEQFAAEQAKAAKFQQEAEAAKAELAKFQQEQEKASVEARLAKFRDEGRLTPAEFGQAVGLAMQLQGEYREQYFAQIGGRPPVLETSEKAPANKAAPAGGSTSPAEQVRKFAKENNLSFEAAAQRLAQQNPALFEQEGA